MRNECIKRYRLESHISTNVPCKALNLTYKGILRSFIHLDNKASALTCLLWQPCQHNQPCSGLYSKSYRHCTDQYFVLFCSVHYSGTLYNSILCLPICVYSLPSSFLPKQSSVKE